MSCSICGKDKYIRKSQLQRGVGKFCSKICQGYSLRGTHISEEQKQKLRKCKRSEESKQRYSVSKMGENNPQWKGGRRLNSYGYINIKIKNHPFAVKGYVREHRYVVEKIIGKILKPSQVVHHINKIKTDNRPENLMAFTSDSAHQRFHSLKGIVKPKEIIFDGRNFV